MKNKVPMPLSGLLGAVTLALALGTAPVAVAGDAIALLKDIDPGSDPTYGPLGSNPRDFVKVVGAIYFSALDGTDGYYPHLWRTDGTPEGTAVVLGSPQAPSYLTAVGETLFFQAYDAEHGYEPWTFDPSTGVFQLYEINVGPGHSLLRPPTVFQGAVFFGANDGTSYGLYKIVPGEQAVLVRRLGSGYYDAPENLAVMGDGLFFGGREPQDTHARLWRTRGEPDDARMVGPATLTLPPNAAPLTAFEGALFFGATDTGDPQGVELWTSDGDPDDPTGTHMVLEIYPGESQLGGKNSASPGPFAVLNGVLYFTAQSAEGRGLWSTDGTAEGTVLIKNASPFVNAPAMTLTPAGGLLFFVARDARGRELWRSDGTPDGTYLVDDICNPDEYPDDPLACGPWRVADEPHNSSSPTGLTAHAGKIYFSAYHPAHGRELFRSDGSTVELVRDFFPATSYNEYWQQSFPNSSFATPLAEIDGTLYFSADDGVRGLEPWTLRSRTPQEEIAGLIEDVRGLLEQGEIRRWQAFSLIGKLQLALWFLQFPNGEGMAAVMLDLFVLEVELHVRTGVLSAEEGDPLLETARGVIAQLRAP